MMSKQIILKKLNGIKNLGIEIRESLLIFLDCYKVTLRNDERSFVNEGSRNQSSRRLKSISAC